MTRPKYVRNYWHLKGGTLRPPTPSLHSPVPLIPPSFQPTWPLSSLHCLQPGNPSLLCWAVWYPPDLFAVQIGTPWLLCCTVFPLTSLVYSLHLLTNLLHLPYRTVPYRTVPYIMSPLASLPRNLLLYSSISDSNAELSALFDSSFLLLVPHDPLLYSLYPLTLCCTACTPWPSAVQLVTTDPSVHRLYQPFENLTQKFKDYTVHSLTAHCTVQPVPFDPSLQTLPLHFAAFLAVIDS